MKRFLTVALFALVAVAVVGTLAFATEYKNGEYIGYVANDYGDIVVAVAITKGYITNVEIITPVKHIYQYEPGQKAFYEYPGKVLAAQSADIDAVAGATSSYAQYNQAVQMALDIASGTYKGNKFYGITRDYAHGHTLLEVTLNGAKDKIENVKYIVSPGKAAESETLMTAKVEGKYPLAEAIQAFTNLPKQVVEGQTVHVDVVSGATHTSHAFQNALYSALNAAQATKAFE